MRSATREDLYRRDDVNAASVSSSVQKGFDEVDGAGASFEDFEEPEQSSQLAYFISVWMTTRVRIWKV